MLLTEAVDVVLGAAGFAVAFHGGGAGPVRSDFGKLSCRRVGPQLGQLQQVRGGQDRPLAGERLAERFDPPPPARSLLLAAQGRRQGRRIGDARSLQVPLQAGGRLLLAGPQPGVGFAGAGEGLEGLRHRREAIEHLARRHPLAQLGRHGNLLFTGSLDRVSRAALLHRRSGAGRLQGALQGCDLPALLRQVPLQLRQPLGLQPRGGEGQLRLFGVLDGRRRILGSRPRLLQHGLQPDADVSEVHHGGLLLLVGLVQGRFGGLDLSRVHRVGGAPGGLGMVAGAADRAGASGAEVAGQSRRHARELAFTQRSEGGRGQLQPLLGGAQAFDRFAFEPAALAHLAARQGPLGQRVLRLGEAVEAIGGRSGGLQRCFGAEPLIPQ